MANDRKKERRRLKRKERHRELRKERSASPFRVLADASRPLVCYINSDWQKEGMASIQCLKSVRGGDHALVAFLVDLLCCGLKDAFGRLGIGRGEFEDLMQRMEKQGGLHFVPIDLATVQRLVAGGIYYARRNGFKLPRHYERWVAAVGVDADQPTADLTGFGYEGDPDQLMYVGEFSALAPRLASGTVSEFLKRPNVHYIGGLEDEPGEEDELDEGEGDEFDEEAFEQDVLGPLRDQMLKQVQQWSFANGQAPHPRLPEAIDLMYEAMMQAQATSDDVEGEPSDEMAEEGNRLMDVAYELQGDAESELRAAAAQLHAYMDTFQSSEQFAEALGLQQEEE